MWTLFAIAVAILLVVFGSEIGQLNRSMDALSSWIQRLADRVAKREDSEYGDDDAMVKHDLRDLAQRLTDIEKYVGLNLSTDTLSDCIDKLGDRVAILEEGSTVVAERAPIGTRDLPTPVDQSSREEADTRSDAPRALPALRRVCEFHLELTDAIWQRLGATATEIAYASAHDGLRLGVCLEFWDTHTVIRSGESSGNREPSSFYRHRHGLPNIERTRTLYASTRNEARRYAVLWECLLDQQSRIQLRLVNGSTLLLCAVYGRFGFEEDAIYRTDRFPQPSNVLATIPLSAAELEPLRRPSDDQGDLGPETWEYFAEPSLTVYDSPESDPPNGLQWALWLHDFEQERRDALLDV